MEMKMKHTPGPWVIMDGDYFEEDKVITTKARMEQHEVCIAQVSTEWDGTIGLEQQANARLILAAPLLLKALKYARRVVNASECDIAYIDSTIAAATGEQA